MTTGNTRDVFNCKAAHMFRVINIIFFSKINKMMIEGHGLETEDVLMDLPESGWCEPGDGGLYLSVRPIVTTVTSSTLPAAAAGAQPDSISPSKLSHHTYTYPHITIDDCFTTTF